MKYIILISIILLTFHRGIAIIVLLVRDYLFIIGVSMKNYMMKVKNGYDKKVKEVKVKKDMAKEKVKSKFVLLICNG